MEGRMTHQLFVFSEALVRGTASRPRIAIGASGLLALPILRSAAALILYQPV
jgi:hypothetical protein